MNRADEGVVAGLEGRDVVGLLGDPAEDLALEYLFTGRRALVDRDVVGGALVLVLELDLERRAGLGRQVCDVLDVLA